MKCPLCRLLASGVADPSGGIPFAPRLDLVVCGGGHELRDHDAIRREVHKYDKLLSDLDKATDKLLDQAKEGAT